jgi:molecular chaperone GrpE
MEDKSNDSSLNPPEPGGHSHPHANQEHPSRHEKKHESGSGRDSGRPKERESAAARVRQLEEENRDLKDRWLRAAAEADNIRKRAEKDRTQSIQSANADILRAVLPIGDDLERSLKSSAETDAEAFRAGVEMIAQKLNGLLKARGVTPMETVGLPFDVDQHDALLHTEREGVPPGMVLEEYEKGYRLNGQVLRHAKVVVSK